MGGQSIETYTPSKLFWALLLPSMGALWAAFAVHEAFFVLFVVMHAGNLCLNHLHHKNLAEREQVLDAMSILFE